MNIIKTTIFLAALILLNACTTVSVDEMRWQETSLDFTKDSVVILGRHHSPEYETEPELVSCIGSRLRSNIRGLNVIPEDDFVDLLYPWFEPRTAPLTMEKFIQVLDEPLIRDELERHGIRYMVWVEGATETINQIGSMSCAIGPGGGGCFGFGSWENQSEYEASIWDFENTREAGRISTDAQGTSYMPAIVIPIPLIARVQSNACDGMGTQLSAFLAPEAS
ncbi:MAG: hypothetical protein RLN82_05925 [Pseudomonadales bacterium]